MTLDKFNRHLYQHNHHKLLLVEGLTELKCEIMFYLGALGTDKDGNYAIINSNMISEGLAKYTFPLDQAIVKTVTWTPKNVKVYINDKEYNTKSLIGVTLKKGDQIRVKHHKRTTELFALEAVVSVPVEADRT